MLSKYYILDFNFQYFDTETYNSTPIALKTPKNLYLIALGPRN
jgi:hypothetical protein